MYAIQRLCCHWAWHTQCEETDLLVRVCMVVLVVVVVVLVVVLVVWLLWVGCCGFMFF